MKRGTRPAGAIDEARLQRLRARVAAMSAITAAAVAVEGCDRQQPVMNTPAPEHLNTPAPRPTVNNPPVLVAAPDAAPPAPDAAASDVPSAPPEPPLRPPTINRPPSPRPRVPPGNG